MAEDRLTAEDLAAAAGVSADLLREWRELGLLHADPQGRFDADSVERIRLIRFAGDRGVPAKDVARLAARRGDDLLGRYLDQIGASRPTGRSLDDAAALTGLPASLAHRFWIAAGLAGEEVLDDDLEMMRIGARAIVLGLPEEALLQIVRVLADSLTRVADAESRLFHYYVHEQLRSAGMADDELAETVDAISDPLMELIEPTVLYFHRRAWSRALREDMVVHLREDLAPTTGDVGETRVAVLFVDLASFTLLTEAMGDVEAAKVLDRFSDLVREAAGLCGGRVLKQIGDEFMVILPSSSAAVTCGIDIARRAADEPQFPAVRIGAHSGTALYREADYLGATVNIAARVGSEAGRGQFLVSDAIRAEAAPLPAVSFDPAGERTLKGVADPLPLFTVRHDHIRAQRAIDPVCGMELAQDSCDVSLDWHGREVFFCSEACLEQFSAAPQRFDPS